MFQYSVQPAEPLAAAFGASILLTRRDLQRFDKRRVDSSNGSISLNTSNQVIVSPC